MNIKENQKFKILGQSFILSQYFRIGGLKIRYYGLTMASAVVAGYIVGSWQARKRGLSQSFFDDVAFWLVLVSFICARIYYVLFYPQFYIHNWAEAFKIWHGGISIYGGVIGGIVTLWIIARKKKVSFWKLADIAAFALPLAQAIGRFGNFFNYEAFGIPTNLPWKMYVPPQFRPAGYSQYSFFSPTFAYEAIWDVLVFFGLLLLSKKFFRDESAGKSRDGFIAGWYLILYSIGRYFIEGIRLDSAFFGPFRGDQITAIVLIIAGSAILFKRYASQSR